MRICFIMGNSSDDERIFQLLMDAVERNIKENGVQDFIVCNNNDFDRTAAAAVLAAKKKYPFVTLSLFSMNNMETAQEEVYKVYSPVYESKCPKWYAVVKEKRHIIDSVGKMIIYNCDSAKSTLELVEYARKREAEGKLHIEEIVD